MATGLIIAVLVWAILVLLALRWPGSATLTSTAMLSQCVGCGAVQVGPDDPCSQCGGQVFVTPPQLWRVSDDDRRRVFHQSGIATDDEPSGARRMAPHTIDRGR